MQVARRVVFMMHLHQNYDLVQSAQKKALVQQCELEACGITLLRWCFQSTSCPHLQAQVCSFAVSMILLYQQSTHSLCLSLFCSPSGATWDLQPEKLDFSQFHRKLRNTSKHPLPHIDREG